MDVYHDKYKDSKLMYLGLKNLELTGGGAWDFFSNSNDFTQDMLSDYGILTNNQYHTNIASTNRGLKKMFNDFDTKIKEKDPTVKHPDRSSYNVNHGYLCVIIDMLLHLCQIKTTYLKRGLVHAYREYIRIYMTKEASGWKSYSDRLKCLKSEILLINYSINQGTPLKIPKEYFYQDNTINPNALAKFFDKIERRLIIDDIFLRYKKNKPKYRHNKFEVIPLLDPMMLDLGIIMEGYNGSNHIEYYVVAEKKDKHIWKRYDPFVNVATALLPIEVLYDIYGDIIMKLNKKDIRQLKK